jgi:hypothetical protein
MAYFLKPKNVYYMSFPAAIICIGFLVSYIKYKPGDLGIFDGNVWWNNLRFIHGIIYGVFAYLAYTHNKHAYIALLIDVIVGIIAFLLNYRVIS